MAAFRIDTCCEDGEESMIWSSLLAVPLGWTYVKARSSGWRHRKVSTAPLGSKLMARDSFLRMKSPPSRSRERDGKVFMSPRMRQSHPSRKARSIWRDVKSVVALSSLMPWMLDENLGAMAADGPYVPTILSVSSSSSGAQAATARPYSSFSWRVRQPGVERGIPMMTPDEFV